MHRGKKFWSTVLHFGKCSKKREESSTIMKHYFLCTRTKEKTMGRFLRIEPQPLTKLKKKHSILASPREKKRKLLRTITLRLEIMSRKKHSRNYNPKSSVNSIHFVTLNLTSQLICNESFYITSHALL